jgi:hypothetical protein
MRTFRTLALAAFLLACGSSKPAETTTPPTTGSGAPAEPVEAEEPDTAAQPVAEKQAAPTISDADLDAAMDRLTRFMEGVADGVTAAKGDCNKAADAARAVWEKDKDAVKGMMTVGNATPEQQQTLMTKYGPRMEAAEKKMGDLDTKCKDNAKWQQLEKDMMAALGQ